jgi:hypothetical protein
MTEEITGPYRFTVKPRPAELGGGWRLRAYELIPGREEMEVHGGIFPAAASSAQASSMGAAGPAAALPGGDDLAYTQALAAAQEWLAQMPPPDYRDGEHYMLGCFARDAAAQLGD